MTDDERKDYQLAGELFGLLSKGVGFGSLTMFGHVDRFIAYQWRFHGGGESYGSRFVFYPRQHRIDQRGSLDALAERVVEDWKRFHRGIEEKAKP